MNSMTLMNSDAKIHRPHNIQLLLFSLGTFKFVHI